MLLQLLHAGHVIVQSHVMMGVIGGFGTAVSADIVAFRTWKTWGDGRNYDWSVASFKWFQGMVIGGVLGAGWGALLGVQ